MKKLIDLSVIKLARHIQSNLKRGEGLYRHNLHGVLWERAMSETADYVEPHLAEAMVFRNKHEIWDYTARQLADRTEGLCLEFGVYQGHSINYISRQLPRLRFYGFDSFEGLAEDWKGHFQAKGAFNVGGQLPPVNDNVTLIKGWFNQTLPGFIEKELTGKDLAMIHVDGDTYEAAEIVFRELESHIRPGLLILFDEYLGFPGWRHGEYRAWQEHCQAHGINYRYRGFAGAQVLVEVI